MISTMEKFEQHAEKFAPLFFLLPVLQLYTFPLDYIVGLMLVYAQLRLSSQRFLLLTLSYFIAKGIVVYMGAASALDILPVMMMLITSMALKHSRSMTFAVVLATGISMGAVAIIYYFIPSVLDYWQTVVDQMVATAPEGVTIPGLKEFDLHVITTMYAFAITTMSILGCYMMNVLALSVAKAENIEAISDVSLGGRSIVVLIAATAASWLDVAIVNYLTPLVIIPFIFVGGIYLWNLTAQTSGTFALRLLYILTLVFVTGYAVFAMLIVGVVKTAYATYAQIFDRK